MKFTAKDILQLLLKKHSKDIAVSECKTAIPWFVDKYFQMDAWIVTRRTTRVHVIAYEIKVDRIDFLTDKKWEEYLKYCNEFYFVAPKGVIFLEDLPPRAGLYEVSKTGTVLFKKKTCTIRNVYIPKTIFEYVLMCRSSIK